MKCKYVKSCKLYDKESVVCNRDGGGYYGGVRPAGCYRKLERKQNINKR